MPRERSISVSRRLEARSRLRQVCEETLLNASFRAASTLDLRTSANTRTDDLGLGAQVESVNQQTEAAQEDDRRQIGGDNGRNGNGRSQATIAAGEVLNDSCQQHVQQPSTNLFAASNAGARRRYANLRDILPAVGAARQMREHGLPTEHARARGHRLALQRDRHWGRETSKSA